MINPLSSQTPEQKAAGLKRIQMERRWIASSFELGELRQAAWAFLAVWTATDRTGLTADDLAEIMAPYVERLAHLMEGESDA